MNKKAKPSAPGGSPTDKVRLSLVFKLNLRMLGMLLSVFFSLDLLLIFLFAGTALWRAETGARNLLVAYESSGKEGRGVLSGSSVTATGYVILRTDQADKGWLLPELIQGWLPLQKPEARRWLSLPAPWMQPRLLSRLEGAVYHVSLVVAETPLEISYALAPDLRQIFFILVILVLSQFLYLLSRIGRNNQVIRQTLKPLTEMAATAKSIQQDMSTVGPSGAGIKRLAGAISKLNARQLNQGLSIETSQEELKDLASAINDLLQRINQAYQSQVRFVADASHELRTPLSVLQGYANLLDRWGKHDEKIMQEAINAIKNETEQMKVLVEHLLFLARSDSDTIHPEKTVFDCGKVVAEIVRETRLIDPDHTFENYLPGPVYLEADQQLIKQALRILVDNSIKYTPAGGVIQIKVGQEKDTVKIQVQDNGIGIAPADVPHIFDRFYRSDESRARKTGGSGLGLAIVKWIVENHGGYYEVLSRLEIGTRITLNFPAASKPPAKPEKGEGGAG